MRSLLRLPLLGLLLTAALAAHRAHAQEGPQKVALLVGVNEYDKRGFAERPLQFAERDVEQLAAELKRHGFTVRVLTGSAQGKDRATRANVEAAVQETLAGRNARDVVLVIMAGHGQQMPLRDEQGRVQTTAAGVPLEDAFFCPRDALKGDPRSMISLTGLMQTLDRQGGVNLVLVDACRDDPDPGRGMRSITGNELNGRLPANTAVVFSCAAGQQALETKDAGGGHGVFLYHVLEGLRGEAAKRNGDVTWSSLVEYVRDHTNDRAKEWFPDFAPRARDGRLQTPHELRNLIDVPVLARIDVKVRPSLPEPIPEPRDDARLHGSRAGEERDDNGLRMKLVWCPPGRFTMGSPEDEIDRYYDEAQVEVTLTQGFWLGKYEVTQALWRQVMGSEPWKGEESVQEGADYPATYVSWEDATEFCRKLTEQERRAGRLPAGWEYALPTEAQWEYACRAGTTTRFSFGEDESRLGEYAWFDKNADLAGEQYAHEVGRKRANAWGLHDMHGNVEEWCRDGYAERLPGGHDPEEEWAGEKRMSRGGSWRGEPWECRSAQRANPYLPPGFFSDPFNGFRVARVPSGK